MSISFIRSVDKINCTGTFKTQSLIQKFTFLISSDLFLLKTSCQSVKLPLSICHPERLWSHVPLSCTFPNSFVFVKNLPQYCESYVGMFEYQVCRIRTSILMKPMDVVEPFHHVDVLFMVWTFVTVLFVL